MENNKNTIKDCSVNTENNELNKEKYKKITYKFLICTIFQIKCIRYKYNFNKFVSCINPKSIEVNLSHKKKFINYFRYDPQDILFTNIFFGQNNLFEKLKKSIILNKKQNFILINLSIKDNYYFTYSNEDIVENLIKEFGKSNITVLNEYSQLNNIKDNYSSFSTILLKLKILNKKKMNLKWIEFSYILKNNFYKNFKQNFITKKKFKMEDNYEVNINNSDYLIFNNISI